MDDQFNLKINTPQRWNQYLNKSEKILDDVEFIQILVEFMQNEKKFCEQNKLAYGPFAAMVAIPREVVFLDGSQKTIDNQFFLQEERQGIQKVLSWRPISLGCNQVVITGQAILHGEVVAAMLAGQYFKDNNFIEPYDFSKNHCLLATTSAPCEMCLNVIKWLKPKKIITGGSRLDTYEHTCFNEGLCNEGLKVLRLSQDCPEQESWVAQLNNWGVDVSAGIMRKQVVEEILKPYQGVVYQPE
ncbi:MAG TPA: hypothetical protein PKC21_04415 [Oligoflexia bacterium]|nr:hypothetical protein [Oligoflexia bacterium]HMR24581.1 hypothetical protein [Oligoflexia bacterium]